MRDIVRLKIERELVRIKIDDTNAFSNEIGVNVGVSKLMLPSINLLLPVLVSAARHILTTVRHKLMLPGITYYYWYNLVAFLEKPEESDGFEGIIDFLNASSIRYALIVNPTIYTTCIEQFWATAKAKTVNGERQIQALVDKKTVIITEMSVRSDLKTGKNEKQSRRKQRKRSGPTEPIPNEATIEEHIPTHSNDPLLSGEDRLQLNELMEICTNLQKKVLDLETSKAAQAQKISRLKQRVKKLEKKKKSRPHGLSRLYKVGSSRRVESSKGSLGAQEDASKQRRKIADLDVDEEVTLIDETQGRNDEDLMFDTGVLNGDELKLTSATITVDELTLAQTLIEIKAAKPKAVTTAATTVTHVSTRPKAKGVVIQEPSETTTTTTTITTISIPLRVQDKGKGKMVETEPEKKTGKKTQIQLDEELAFRMHAEEQAELERMQREIIAQEEASRATINEELDRIQAMIEADEQLTARLQVEEQEQFSIEEKSRMLVEMIVKEYVFCCTKRESKGATTYQSSDKE
ncbi:hypothetical protein Tco_0721149 [Tanacetum coccineum]